MSEWHCKCVPMLQARVNELEDDNEAIGELHASCLKAIEQIGKENARLRKVVDAASGYLKLAKSIEEDGEGCQSVNVDHALRELDGENKELPENVCQWCLEKNCTVC